MGVDAEVGSKRVRVGVVGRVVLVYWHDSPDVLGVRTAMDELARARMTIGAPLLVCAYVPEWVEPPPPNVRRFIVDATPDMLKSCDSIHTVQAGEGVLPTAFRTVGRTMVLAGGFRGKVFIHASLEDFFASTHDRLGAPSSEIRRELERMGGAMAPGAVRPAESAIGHR